MKKNLLLAFNSSCKQLGLAAPSFPLWVMVFPLERSPRLPLWMQERKFTLLFWWIYLSLSEFTVKMLVLLFFIFLSVSQLLQLSVRFIFYILISFSCFFFFFDRWYCLLGQSCLISTESQWFIILQTTGIIIRIFRQDPMTYSLQHIQKQVSVLVIFSYYNY